ncbi:hypothetical protein RM863_29180 [Streptomyces sp. DSM 41014]|uniref:Uncharacterized protein n=1 Tax=Streptomyces hintoniae TaxID=3075521 RepID=A0ABU2USF3_9ACTN|nr:hypothetical protein [Streptomyces sp. DSM 41014]MDT0476205.1 hypothetical protein [Streptomyces sp. DSM 41014]
MNGPTTLVEALPYGVAVGALLLAAIKAALERGRLPDYWTVRRQPPAPPPPLPTARTRAARHRHTAPPGPDENQPVTRFPSHARHAKDAA